MTDAVAFIYPADRDIAGVWAASGEVPDDRAAREHAATLCARFLAAYDLLAGSLDTIIEKANRLDELVTGGVIEFIEGQGDLFGEAP